MFEEPWDRPLPNIMYDSESSEEDDPEYDPEDDWGGSESSSESDAERGFYVCDAW